jgi:hypothetical protein
MALRRGLFLVGERASRAVRSQSNRLSTSRLPPVVLGRRSEPPAWRRHCRSGAPTAVLRRERPPEMAAWPAKPAASEVVAHATLKHVGAHVGGRHSAAGVASAPTGPSREIHHTILPVSDRRSTRRSQTCRRARTPTDLPEIRPHFQRWPRRETSAITSLGSSSARRRQGSRCARPCGLRP